MKTVAFVALVVAGASLVGVGAAFAKPGGHMPQIPFEKMDADGNGEISKAELEAKRKLHFEAADSDADGQLTIDEMAAYRAKQAASHAERMMKRLDKNGDGQLSLEEMPDRKQHGDMFDRLDADQSGGISKEEYAAQRQAHARGDGKGEDKGCHGHGGHRGHFWKQLRGGQSGTTDQN